MTFYEGYMELDGAEIFSNRRTFTNMQEARGFSPPNSYGSTLPWNFQLASDSIPDADCGDAFDATPPWATDCAESDEFLGFWVFSVSGLDDRHNARTATPRSSWPFGSTMGRLTPTHRTITYEIAMIGLSVRGLNYGMEWLARQVRAVPGCTECGLHEMTIHNVDPALVVDVQSEWTLKDVGVAEGPEWGDWLTEGTARYARQATVSFYAGDPCRYSDPTFLLAELLVVDFPLENTCAGVVGDCNASLFDLVPIIHIIPEDAGGSTPVTVQVLVNNSGDCCTAPGSFDSYLEIHVGVIPVGSRVVIDGGQRTITDGAGNDMSQYIDISGGFVRWAQLACASSLCMIVTPESATGRDTLIAMYYAYRAGC